MRKAIAVVFCLVAGTAYAQEWEVGGMAGFGYSPKLTVDSPFGDVKAGIGKGQVFGAFGGNDMYEHWSSEVRYLYRYGDAEVESGGTSASLGSHTHIVNVDFLGHFRPRASKVRPFFAFGGGVKVIQGTGLESSSQPLGQSAALTATRDVLGVGDVGAGVKVNVSELVRLRFEFRDYISGAPTRVITPAPGSSLGGIMNDFVATIGISLYW